MNYKDPEKAAEYAREWRARNPERAREIDAKRRKKQPVGLATEKMHIWRIENPEKAKAQADIANRRVKERLATDPIYAEKRRQQRAAYMAIPGVRERRRKQWREWVKEARKKFPGLSRRRHLKHLYGLTVDQYDTLLQAQNGRCAICSSDKPGGRGKHWHVDHCHDQGHVRGLLCRACNTGLGVFKDDPALLRAAIAYLKKGASSWL
jgi:hypothetical protein